MGKKTFARSFLYKVATCFILMWGYTCALASASDSSSVLSLEFADSTQTSKVQRKSQGSGISILSAKNADSTIQSEFLSDTPKLFAVAPGMPLFTIVGQNNSFFLGLGGYAKATLSCDWGTPMTRATHFTTSAIDMNMPPGNRSLTQIGVGTSNLFLNFVGLPESKNRVSVYINANLAGPNYAVNLLFAYLNYRGITAGYDFTLFSDVAATNPSIDFEGPNGLILIPNTVINYRHTFSKHFSAGIGLEMPYANFAQYRTDASKSVYQSIPDVPFFAKYSWRNGTSWFRAAGLLRGLEYRDLISQRNYTSFAWGANLSTSIHLTRKLIFCAQFTFGSGISQYYQDTFRMGLDMMPTTAPQSSSPSGDNTYGKLQNVQSIGGTIGLRYDFTDNIFGSCTYSFLKLKSPGFYLPDLFLTSDYAVANLFWKINSQIYVGAEYLWGQRQNMNHHRRNNNRLQAMVQVKF